MKIPVSDEEYEAAKSDAQKLYHAIKNVWCPALNDDIIFDAIGFQHLMQKGHERRARREQMQRFALLQYARRILEDPYTAISHSESRNTQTVRYWSFVDTYDNIKIKVIVFQIKEGKKYFLSIYGKKQKSAS